MGLQYHRRAKGAGGHFAARPRARLLARGSFPSDAGFELGQKDPHQPALTRVGGQTRYLEFARSQKVPRHLDQAHEGENLGRYCKVIPRAGEGHAEAVYSLYTRPGQCLLPRAADQIQISPPITISTSTSFTLCAKLQARKPLAKLSALKTSSRS